MLTSAYALMRGLRAIWLAEMALQPPSWLPLIASEQKSDGSKEDYPWLGEAPQVEEILDEWKFTPLSEALYTLTNKMFGSGIEVKRTLIRDDQYGIIMMRVRQLAAVAARFPMKYAIDTIVAGTSATGYDGVAFFSASHPARGKQTATQDNTKSGTGTTTAQFAADLNDAIAQMAGFKAENNEPLFEQVGKLVVLAHPTMRKPVREALGAEIISSTSNVAFQGDDIQPIFSARLTDTNDWYLLNVEGPVKPLIFQNREPLDFFSLDDVLATDSTFTREVYKYKTRWAGAMGYGRWQQAIKVANS